VLICPVTHRAMPLEGRMLDRRFRFVRMLGEGGMSTVWMAENVRVRKHVAIKLMHPEYARNPKTLARFQNEATAAGRIGNPHICDILDFGESPLGPYMVMEMLKGQAFADLLESQGRIDPPLAVLIISEALKGLAAAHAAGIIHRDLKPENVFLHEPEPGRMLVKLVDFGISKFTEDPGGGKTGANVIMGTPEYMAPEQAAGAANVDARADIWAMGVMLYRALAGVEPFKGKTMAALLVALSTENPAPLTNYVPSLPPGLVAVVERCLRKKPDERFASANELVEALAPYQQAVAVGERPVAPPVPPERALSINIDPMTIGSMSIAPQPGTVVAGPGGGVPGATVVAGPGAGHVAAPHAFAPTISGPGPGMPPAGMPPAGMPPAGMPPAGMPPAPGRPAGPPLRPPPGVAEGATWSTELDPNAASATNEASWGSQGLRTFSDEEGRPDEHRKKSGGGWVGWVIGVTTLGLLVGGGVFAWQAGMFGGGGDQQVASSEAGDEAEAGAEASADTVAAGTTTSGTTTGELPADGTTTTTGTTTGEPAEGTTTGEPGTTSTTSTTGEPDSTTSTTSTTGEPAGEDEGGDESTTSGGSGSGGSTSGGSTSGGSTSGGSTSGGDGDGDGDGDPTPKVDLAKLHRAGNLYTPKEKGPAGTYAAAKSHCASLKKNDKFGLSGWRMATTKEILDFKAVADKLQYWGSETEAANAKVVTLLNGRIGSLPQTDSKPRAFCVSKR
jgi:serine/threonine-protein kinase